MSAACPSAQPLIAAIPAGRSWVHATAARGSDAHATQGLGPSARAKARPGDRAAGAAAANGEARVGAKGLWARRSPGSFREHSMSLLHCVRPHLLAVPGLRSRERAGKHTQDLPPTVGRVKNRCGEPNVRPSRPSLFERRAEALAGRGVRRCALSQRTRPNCECTRGHPARAHPASRAARGSAPAPEAYGVGRGISALARQPCSPRAPLGG